MNNKQFREVIPDEIQSENWKELTINTDGTPSTLQDVKVQQRAGGFRYKKTNFKNRFIYWRTNHDILELVEQSLDVNLVGNHVRYRFTDMPILEGISVHETINSVVVLVATVSSVHRLTFKHPEKLHAQDGSDLKGQSIFRDTTPNDTRDSVTYHIINSTPYLPHTSASCLAPNNCDAVFALALATGSILLVTLDPLIGNATTVELRHESIVPRFLSGLTEALLGRNSEDNVPVSLALHNMNNETYLFSVYQNGQLRAWSCSRASCLSITDISDRQEPRVLGAQKHVLRKAVDNRGVLVLAVYFCYSENSHVVVTHPRLNNGIFNFNTHFSIYTLKNHDLVELVLADGGEEVWCVWVTGSGDSAISHTHINSGTWSWVTLEPPPPLNLPPDPTLDPRQIYLDAIFKPGVFTASDIQKALSINRRGLDDGNTLELSLRQQVCQMISQEILDEVSQFDVTDEEYLEVSNRCWSHLYSCCVQYHQTGMPALGLLPLPSCLLVIKKQRISVLRRLDYLEASLLDNNLDTEDGESYLLRMLLSIDPGEAAYSKMDLALHLNTSLEDPVAEIVNELEISGLEKLLKGQSKKQMISAIASVLRILNAPECSTREVGEGVVSGVDAVADSQSNCLRSELGLSIIVSTLDQLVNIKLSICRAILVLLFLPPWQGCEPELWTVAQRLSRQLWAQHWACQTLSVSQTPVLKLFLLHEDLTQYSILKSAATLAHYTWAGSADQCGRLAQFLFESREHLLLQELARIVPVTSWQRVVVHSLLEVGEAYKAFDLVSVKGADMTYYIEMIQLFEKYNCRDLVLELANQAVTESEPDNPALPMLRSATFLHHLSLGHYIDAYASLEAQTEESRRKNCLVELVSALVESNEIRLLLELPFTGMLGQLEEFLECRARARDPAAAATYYDTLFALHIKNMNFRKGAAVMFEQGLRADNPELRQQCYAVCLNALSLVEPNYAWIVKPTGKKNNAIDVLELKDIRREYHLALACSRLRNCPSDSSPEEVVGQCVATGHYKTALRLCHLWGLGYTTPLQALATACVEIQDDDKAWQWLFFNEIADLVAGDANATTIAWRLLDYLLNKYEEDGQSTLYKAVASKLISLCVFLPHWLEASYKKRNCAELLRLYLNHGALAQASELGCELLAACLGQGKELCGFKHALLPTTPPACLPLNTIDRLLAELSHHKMDGDLRKAVDKYLETCKRVSDDKINSAIMCF